MLKYLNSSGKILNKENTLRLCEFIAKKYILISKKNVAIFSFSKPAQQVEPVESVIPNVVELVQETEEEKQKRLEKKENFIKRQAEQNFDRRRRPIHAESQSLSSNVNPEEEESED
ncbi:hypothetical protein BpHYR1_033982 [Brachionus plicatilis]|uniref:Uncharacterized protein n=1 Tax=Brachionus plicatilis TaxID=10195 RepID=A0A3M7R4Y1_BRAPC|nr:hypothetical protein BpHYR1_033982 [Brachionus plicatilis]